MSALSRETRSPSPDFHPQPSDFHLELCTLLIKVSDNNERHFIQLVLDKKHRRLLLFTSRHDVQSVDLEDILYIRYGPEAEMQPERFGLDGTVQPFWFTMAYLVNGKETQMNLLALDPQVAQSWSTLVLHRSRTPSADMKSYAYSIVKPDGSAWFQILQDDANAEKLQAIRSRIITGTEVSTSFKRPERDSAQQAITTQMSLHYWVEWPFMTVLNGRQWDDEAIHSVKAHVSNLVRFDEQMMPLEAKERELWEEYLVTNGQSIPALPLVHDELLKAYMTPGIIPGISSDKRLRRLSYLQKLERLRREKAWALDHFEEESGSVGKLGYMRHVPQHPVVSDKAGSPDIAEYYSSIGSRFWAVIVGINTYDDPHMHDLHGCVADARLVAEYLTTSLHVPESHILMLTTPSNAGDSATTGILPTRVNILDALYSHLRDNPRVQRSDNLLFHFSGHGSSYEVIPMFGTSFTETICPMDRGHKVDAPTVYDISGRELNTIFSEICEAKGPNLTVIFDSCHSGGAARSLSPNRVRATWAINDTNAVSRMFDSAERDPRRIRERRLQSPLWAGRMDTHVLLAACNPEETAKEVKIPQGGKLGAFTFALISALNSPQGVDPMLTYVDLVQNVLQPPPLQTVMVAGTRRGSRLWFQDGPPPLQVVTSRREV